MSDQQPTKRRVGRPITQPCGTVAAVRRHEYHREPTCEQCRPVQRRIRRERRARTGR